VMILRFGLAIRNYSTKQEQAQLSLMRSTTSQPLRHQVC